MKRKMIMAAAVLFFCTSCKKDRVCECTSKNSSTFTDASGTEVTEEQAPVVTLQTYKDVRKKDLANHCGNSRTKSENTLKDQGIVSSSAYTSETKCELK
jgi:hypothetical protein